MYFGSCWKLLWDLRTLSGLFLAPFLGILQSRNHSEAPRRRRAWNIRCRARNIWGKYVPGPVLRRLWTAPWDGFWGPWCVFWFKVYPKRVPKRCRKWVKRELNNRTPAKYRKYGFDTVFTRFWPRRHSQKSHIFGVLGVLKWGPKTGPQENPSVACPWRLWWAPGGCFGDPHYSE